MTSLPDVTLSLPAASQQETAFSLPRRGEICPKCGEGKIDYDGLLNLVCNRCGWSLTGGAGCS